MVTDVTIGCRLAAPVAGACASNCLQDSAGLCVCPRTQLDCSDAEDTKQCAWLDTTKPGEPKSGKCIHKTEAIYNALFKKLSSRGKKSLALSIYYHSKPAQGRAPYGPHGPYIIDAVGHYLQKVNINFDLKNLSILKTTANKFEFSKSSKSIWISQNYRDNTDTELVVMALTKHHPTEDTILTIVMTPTNHLMEDTILTMVMTRMKNHPTEDTNLIMAMTLTKNHPMDMILTTVMTPTNHHLTDMILISHHTTNMKNLMST